MPVKFRNYTKEAGITDDYCQVRNFYIKLGYSEFPYARWDWMATHPNLDKNQIGKIGLWEDDNRLIGVATFDTEPGTIFCLTLPEYSYLKHEMLLYARDNLASNDIFSVMIPDSDLEFQNAAADLDLVATGKKESYLIFYIDKTSTFFSLPEGFRVTTIEDTFDLYQYGRVLWKGFNHELNGEGEFTFSDEKEEIANKEMKRPYVDLCLKVAVVAPDGNFASYCGMWYYHQAGFAVVEPVATDPAYRKMGLGKAAVLEGIRRVGALGAKTALVGSSQQFYYSIGFRPFIIATEWRNKKSFKKVTAP